MKSDLLCHARSINLLLICYNTGGLLYALSLDLYLSFLQQCLQPLSTSVLQSWLLGPDHLVQPFFFFDCLVCCEMKQNCEFETC